MTTLEIRNALSTAVYKLGKAEAAGTDTSALLDELDRLAAAMRKALAKTVAEPMNPKTAAEFLAPISIGMQPGDDLDMPAESNKLWATKRSDFELMAAAGMDHYRIPAICSARADAAGKIREDFLLRVDEQIDWAFAVGAKRVTVDPLHHYHLIKGNTAALQYADDNANTRKLTIPQHMDRAVAMWTQLALRWRDRPLALAFDLINEPGIGIVAGKCMTAQQCDELYVRLIAAIRATGGNNALRTIKLEPYGALSQMVIPKDAGNIIASIHLYNPASYTHELQPLTATGMAQFVEDVRFAKVWSKRTGVPICIDEMGSNAKNVDRPEYASFIVKTLKAEGVPGCFWSYTSGFGFVDNKTRQWLPGMADALAGKLPVRPVPEMTTLTCAIMKATEGTQAFANLCKMDANGVFTAPANTTGRRQRVTLIFPNTPAKVGQIWSARTLSLDEGSLTITPLLMFPIATGYDTARNPDGSGFLSWLQAAPGGKATDFSGLTTDGSGNGVLGVSVLLDVGCAPVRATFGAMQVNK